MGCYIESNGLDTAHLLPRSYHCCHKRRHPMSVAELKDWWTPQSPVHTSGCSCLSVSSRRNCVPGGGGAAAAPWSGRSMTHSAPSLPVDALSRGGVPSCAVLGRCPPLLSSVRRSVRVVAGGRSDITLVVRGPPGQDRTARTAAAAGWTDVQEELSAVGGRGTSTAPGQAAAVGSRGGETASDSVRGCAVWRRVEVAGARLAAGGR